MIPQAPSVLFRVCRKGHEALYFGTGTGFRFNDPALTYGVCYLAYEPAGAFVETLLRERVEDYVDEAELEERNLVTVRVREPLRLVRFYGSGLSKLGTNAVSSHGPYTLSQQWSTALHHHPSQPDGLACREAHDDDLVAVALFDRAADKLETVHSAALSDPLVLEPIAARYDLKL